MKYLLHLIAALILFFLANSIVDSHLRPHFISEGIFIIIMVVVVELGYDIINNRKRFFLIIRCWLLSLRDENIRFSMSYQYRIKINDKYLLVKNSNWGFYQHVGGKYKRLPITQKALHEFGARDDIKLPTVGLTRDDLAVFIPAKNAIKFIDWFNKRQEREISHWREFYEELIEGKGSVLNQKNFPYVNYTYVSSVVTPLKRAAAPGWNCFEILQYDVLDLLPTSQQMQELNELQSKGDSDYLKWADHELIQNLGFDRHLRKERFAIAHHTKWIVNLKWSQE
jgi:hypothetical protein